MNYNPMFCTLPKTTKVRQKQMGKMEKLSLFLSKGFRKMFFNPAQSFTPELSLSFPLQRRNCMEKEGKTKSARKKKAPSPIKLEIYCHARFQKMISPRRSKKIQFVFFRRGRQNEGGHFYLSHRKNRRDEIGIALEC